MKFAIVNYFTADGKHYRTAEGKFYSSFLDAQSILAERSELGENTTRSQIVELEQDEIGYFVPEQKPTYPEIRMGLGE